MKALKITALVLGGILLVLFVALVAARVGMNANYFRGYDPKAPLNVRIESTEEGPVYNCTHLYFDGFRGDSVPAYVMTPKTGPGPYPCVIFLHGIGQSKTFAIEDLSDKFPPPAPFKTISDPFVEAGFVFVTFDQYTRGERKLKDPSPLQEANAFRVRPAYTINDTRRFIDYLQTRPDVIPNRIYLAGASYGAITGATATAFDTRIRAAVLIYGGGGITKFPEAREAARELGSNKWLAKIIGWYFLGVADPIHYAGRIAPRPVFLMNGTDDGLIPTEAAKALQDAVKEPKKIKIYQGDHIGMDPQTLATVLNDTIDWIKEQDDKIVKAEGNRPSGN